MKYNVIIRETLERTIQVNANSKFEAESKVRKLYNDCDIVLTEDDYIETIFSVTESQNDKVQNL